MASMADATFDATSQQSPQTTPTIGESHDDTVGATVSTHVSSTMPASASTVAVATQSNASFITQLNQSLCIFDMVNHRNQPYDMLSSFMAEYYTKILAR